MDDKLEQDVATALNPSPKSYNLAQQKFKIVNDTTQKRIWIEEGNKIEIGEVNLEITGQKINEMTKKSSNTEEQEQLGYSLPKVGNGK